MINLNVIISSTNASYDFDFFLSLVNHIEYAIKNNKPIETPEIEMTEEEIYNELLTILNID